MELWTRFSVSYDAESTAMALDIFSTTDDHAGQVSFRRQSATDPLIKQCRRNGSVRLPAASF